MSWLPPPVAVPPLTVEEIEVLDADMRGAEWMPRLAHALAHLRALHPAPGTSAIIEIRVLPAPRPNNYFCQTPSIAYVAAVEAALRANLFGKSAFVGVNPRNKFRGRKIDVAATTTIVLDLDVEKLDLGATVLMLARFGIEPSMLVVSGNGLHFYIRLATPIIPATETEDTWRRLTIATASDHVFDCNRVMRLAGSINFKSPPTLAYVAGIWPDRVYTLEALALAADAMGVPRRDPREQHPGHVHVPPGRLAPEIPAQIPPDVEAILQRLPSAVAAMIRTGERPEDYAKHGNSELDFRIMCTLKEAGHSDQTVLRIYSTTPVGRLKAWRGGDGYFQRTLAGAKAAVAKDARRDPPKVNHASVIRADFPEWDETISLPRAGN